MRTLWRLLGLGLGRRLPRTDGVLTVAGPADDILVRRDDHGVPHVEAASYLDAAFGLGFCMAQDRAFQLELLQRVVRGTLAELLGEPGVGVDRLSRRIGFHHAAANDLPLSSDDTRGWIRAYVDGINAGVRVGLPRRPHEFVLLRAHPTPWDTLDVVGMFRLMAFLLASNWDVEVVRLKILLSDGPDAVLDLDVPYPADAPVMRPPPAGAGGVGGAGGAGGAGDAGALVDRLADDLARFVEQVDLGGASNAWAVSGSRTASGHPLLAADPHLAPTLPSHWYLAHLSTPDWAAAGAAFVGLPVLLLAHNGHAAWAPTAGLVDNTDLVLERLEDGRVFDGERWTDCEVRREVIRVRGGDDVVEKVLVTPNGPIVSPVLPDIDMAVALRATWLAPHPLDIVHLHRSRSFDDLRDRVRDWSGVTLNLVCADTSGTIGWQLIGRPPLRDGGTVPARGWEADGRWSGELLEADDMPWGRDPDSGQIVAANQAPSDDPRLGRDWLDGLRARRLGDLLAGRDDWDVDGMQLVQVDTTSLLWHDIAEVVLAAPVADDGDARLAQALLAGWDGRVAADSVGAAVFEFFAAELTRRIVRARAPGAARWALGERLVPLIPRNLFMKRRASLVTGLLARQPVGWFERSWPQEVADALGSAVRDLRRRFGDDPSRWTWGSLRPLVLRHPLGIRPPLGRLFNLGPFPVGGDHDTPAQHGVQPADPTLPLTVHPSMRAVIDLGAFENSRFALPGGESGNPASRHYGDQVRAYSSNRGIPIPWHPSAVLATTRRTLRLRPDHRAAR